MQRRQRGRRCGAQLVAQQDTHAVVGERRLGDVPAPGVDLDQQRVARLAEQMALGERARGALGGGELLASAGGKGRARERLEQVGLERRELFAASLDPGTLHAGQQRALDDLQRGLGRSDCGLRIVTGERALGLLGAARDALEVDLGVLGQAQAQLGASVDQAVPDRAPHTRDDRAQTGLRRLGQVAGPEDVEQLLAVDRAVAVDDEEGEQRASLAARQPRRDRQPADHDPQRAAQLDPGAIRTRVAGGLRGPSAFLDRFGAHARSRPPAWMSLRPLPIYSESPSRSGFHDRATVRPPVSLRPAGRRAARFLQQDVNAVLGWCARRCIRPFERNTTCLRPRPCSARHRTAAARSSITSRQGSWQPRQPTIRTRGTPSSHASAVSCGPSSAAIA